MKSIWLLRPFLVGEDTTKNWPFARTAYSSRDVAEQATKDMLKKETGQTFRDLLWIDAHDEHGRVWMCIDGTKVKGHDIIVAMYEAKVL